MSITVEPRRGYGRAAGAGSRHWEVLRFCSFELALWKLEARHGGIRSFPESSAIRTQVSGCR